MILVDAAVWSWRGRRWAHLVSDRDYDELHRFAATLGLRRMAFQGDHYDIDAETRGRAIDDGAVAVDPRELVRRLRDGGLRRRRHRDELRWVAAASLQLPAMSGGVLIEVLKRPGELALLVDRGGQELEVVIAFDQPG